VSAAFLETGGLEDDSDASQAMQKGLLDVDANWVTQGLAQMKSLRWLEVEIEDNDVSRDFKVDFCVDLGKKLSEIAGRRINVLFVEKVVEELKGIKPQVMAWGEPGDDYIWALDS
jgi:hypothetical protein